jgi:hypothetical protein
MSKIPNLSSQPAAISRVIVAMTLAGLFTGCVDLTEPWKKSNGGSNSGLGGIHGTGGGGGSVIDAQNDRRDWGPVFEPIDTGEAGRIGSATGGAVGGIEGSTDGGGGLVTGGTGGDLEAKDAMDTKMNGTGGTATGGSGGRPHTGRGGAGGIETGGSGGYSDAKPDVPDMGVDVPAEVALDLMPDLPNDSSLHLDIHEDITPDAPVTYHDAPSLPGPILHYSFEKVTGTVVPDISQAGNDGTLTKTGYTIEPGKVGNALTLNKGGNGYVSFPVETLSGKSDVTIAVWFKVKSQESWARVFDVGINAGIPQNTVDATTYMNLVPQDESGNLAFAISLDGWGSEQKLLSNSVTTSSGWTHIAIVLASDTSSLYVNGELASEDGSVTHRPLDLGDIDYAFLGRSQFSVDPYFDGQIDEFRIYDRALSETEIVELASQ